MKKYRKKPVVIEAVQWTGENSKEIGTFTGSKGYIVRSSYKECDNTVLLINTLEGDMRASIGDYIIKGIQGEFYPCKEDIFKETYEEVGE